MSNSNESSQADQAIERLVVSMVGTKDSAATSLAKRVLGSHFGSSEDRDFQSSQYQADISSTFRRIGRKATDPGCRRDVEELYAQMNHEFAKDQEEHLSPKMLQVLTKLMGKRMNLPTPTMEAPRRNAPVPPPTGMRSASRRHESFAPVAQPTPRSETSRRPVPTTSLPVSSQAQNQEEKIELEKEEALLLRECLYSLQGIDGERIRYFRKDETPIAADKSDALLTYDGIRVRSPVLNHSLLYTGRVLETRLGSGATDAIRMVGEVGWLYQRIQTYIHNVQHDESKGIVARAFAGHLNDVLREYHTLLTELEARLRSLTLRRLIVDLRNPTATLRILAVVTDGCSHLTGGHLLSALHQHALHGNLKHANQVQSLLAYSSRPWFELLYAWTTQGLLSDPHDEFFVTEHHTVEDKYLWKDKYTVNKHHIPEGLLEKELVGLVFNVGKGINFIRRCLLDGRWSMRLDSSNDDETTEMDFKEDLGYLYTDSEGNPALHRTLLRASELVHTHIIRTLRTDFYMLDHLFALKQFLLLGQGDFFSALMDGLHTEFRERPGVAGIYKHTLLGIVEGALRSTNAKYMPQHVLDRLQVELLVDPDDEANGMFGSENGQESSDQRTVWDIFMLDYQVPDPLVAILHTTVLARYKMVFSLLFNLKRIEFMLNFTWRQSATLQHALQNYGQYNGIDASTSKAYAQAIHLLRTISILRQNMMHLTVNLKSYFMFEVIEGGWQQLEKNLDCARTLDEVIAAHDRYLNGIIRKSLLQTAGSQDMVQEGLSNQVNALLQIAGEFCDLQERVFHNSLSAAEIASEKRREADRRAKQGKWGFDSEQDITEEEDLFGLANHTTMREVKRISKTYNHNAMELLRLLSDKVNANPDDFEKENVADEPSSLEEYGMSPRGTLGKVSYEEDFDPQRFLIAQLDHNGFYGQQSLPS